MACTERHFVFCFLIETYQFVMVHSQLFVCLVFLRDIDEHEELHPFVFTLFSEEENHKPSQNCGVKYFYLTPNPFSFTVSLKYALIRIE